jgi:hypothetical protein
VGAVLLAKVVYQVKQSRLTRRFREQARSHIVFMISEFFFPRLDDFAAIGFD